MNYNETPVADQLLMIDRYRSGMTLTEAAATVGRCRHACKHALQVRNIPLRTRSEAQRQYPFDERFFQTIDSERKAYWLGFFTADGNVHEKDCRVALLLARRDRGHVEKFKADLQSEAPIRDGGFQGKRRYCPNSYLAICSITMYADLLSHGVVPRKSLVAKPWDGPAELMRHYWRGVFDGDGCLHRRKDGYWTVMLVGSRWIVGGFADFVKGVTGVNKAPAPARNIFRISYGGTGLPQAIANALYSDSTISLDRKKALADELITHTPRHPFGSRRTFDHLTPAVLRALKREHGSWYRVAKELKLTQPNLMRIRKRLGMPLGKPCGWKPPA